SALLENWLQEHLRLNVRLEVVKDDDTIASGMSIRYTSPQVEYIVFDFADNNLHHNNQDLAFIYDSTMRRIMQEDVRSVLRELPADALLFITSDHGISPSPSAWVPIPDEVLADVRDCKYRNARAQGNLREEHASKVIDLDARRLGLKGSPALVGEDFSHLLFPRPGYGFRRPGTGYNPDKYSHGGMTLAECLVPMIVMGPKLHDQPAFVLDDLRQVGSHSEDEPLSLEVTLKSLRLGAPPTAVTLQFSDKGPATRREVIDKQEARYILSWRPRLDEITPEDRDRGTLSLPVTVTLIYQWEGRTVRSSRTIDMQIKLDPDRVRRRLHTGLDLLMGKVPKGLQS
ncbi:MAG: hypothetical protein GX552_19655, partial [Chloroflexi bacterium]|nr:hypothetical protein [Chloroflexota bacterium]